MYYLLLYSYSYRGIAEQGKTWPAPAKLAIRLHLIPLKNSTKMIDKRNYYCNNGFVFRPAPKNEDEMMVAIFECIDRLFRIVRPRKLLYMAIDGVVSFAWL